MSNDYNNVHRETNIQHLKHDVNTNYKLLFYFLIINLLQDLKAVVLTLR